MAKFVGKVLIIEDRRDNIVFIANKILKPEGWEVITARDGKLGLEKAIDEKPDLIITDLKLPKMHGLDVLEELNKRGYSIPAIVMTFHGSEETAIRAFRLGAVDYLIKPFDIEDMLAAIDRALQGGSDRAASAGEEADLSRRLSSQEQEIQRLKSLLQQKERALQELQRSGSQAQPAAAGSDTARWQAALKERETALAKLQKQMAAQSQAMSQEVGHLKAQLAEKEALVMEMQSRAFRSASAAGAQPELGDLPAQLEEKERALTQADRLVKTLTRTVAVQQKAIENRREEAERLAHELHVLAAGIQMLGQGLGDQASQMTSVLPKEK